MQDDLQGIEAAKAAAQSDYEACILAALEPVTQPAPDLWPEKHDVAEIIKEGRGFWKPCNGCHESNEGYHTGPHHPVLQCAVGLGCHECGGIGAVWDTTDYADMGEFIAALEPVAAPNLKRIGTGLYETQLAPDPALRPTMTDMMVDPDTLDAFMEANPLPDEPDARLRASVAQLDAMTPEVRALVDALERIESITVHSGGEIHGVTALHWQTAFEIARDEAAITLAAFRTGEKK